MASLIVRLFSNAAALWVANLVIPGFVVNNGLKGFVLAGLLLGALNLTVKPILKFISAPLIILTLGIFSLIINGLMLWLVSYALDFVVIQTIGALAGATIIVTFANIFLGGVSKLIIK